MLRKRGLVPLGGLVLIVALLPLPDYRVPFKVLVVSGTLVVFLAMLYLKTRATRSLRMKNLLHQISHLVRDKYVDMHQRSHAIDMEGYSNELCFLIREYFSILTQTDLVGAAIRCAKRVGGATYYSTVGRAGLSANRSATSQDLHEDAGLAKLCRSARHGVFVINDLAQAERDGSFFGDANTRGFPDDIRTMMVCPINGWDGEDKGMLGILYVTSRSSNAFGEKYADSMGFIADALANVYSELILGAVSQREDGTVVRVSEDERYLINGEGSEPIKIS